MNRRTKVMGVFAFLFTSFCALLFAEESYTKKNIYGFSEYDYEYDEDYVTNDSFNFPMETINDFPEIEIINEQQRFKAIVDDELHYTYPELYYRYDWKNNVAHIDDCSDAIYIALYIMQKMDENYVSQELFSSIVGALVNSPSELCTNYYKKIYIVHEFHLKYLIAFAFNGQNQYLIDIYHENGKKSILINFTETDKLITKHDNICYYDIESSDFGFGKIRFPKEFLHACNYALRHYNYLHSKYADFITSESLKKFNLNETEKKLYDELTAKLNNVKPKEYLNSYESIIILEKYFETHYFEPSYLERMAITELFMRNRWEFLIK